MTATTRTKVMSVYEFGSRLLETGDLDPVYIMLYHARLEPHKLKRWLWAYWCFYHCGTASWMTDQMDFWGAMAAGAASKAYPRSSERRHFRGKAAIQAVESMAARRMTASEMVDELCDWDHTPSLQEVSARAQETKGFGEWIGFKIADMLERLDLCQVEFKPADVFDMFEAPLHGAAEMWRRHGDDSNDDEDIPVWAYRRLTEKLGTYKAPPRYERPINIQEVETILCKWKSHTNGHYEIGKDTHEIRHGLLQFARGRTAQNLLKGGRVGKLW